MPFLTSKRRGKWLSRRTPAAALQEESRQPPQPQQRSRYYQSNHSHSSPPGSFPVKDATIPYHRSNGNDTSWTHSESSFEGVGKEVSFSTTPQRLNRSDDDVTKDKDDDVSSIHFGESVSGDGIRRHQKQQQKQRRRHLQFPTKRSPPHSKSVTASITTVPSSNCPRRGQQLQPQSDLLLDTIALAHEDSSSSNNNSNQVNHQANTSKKEKLSDSYQKQQQHAPKEPATVDKADINIIHDNDNMDAVSWQPHESPDSASEAFLSFVSNMTLGSAAGALTSSAVGLSLLTLTAANTTSSPMNDDDGHANKRTAKTAAANLVQQSLERHIHVCLDHCRASSRTSAAATATDKNPFAATSLPVDVDDVHFVQTTPQGVDEAALQHVAEGEPNKAMEIFRVLLQNQRRQRRGTHSYDGSSSENNVVEESEITRTKSRLTVLNLLVGNTQDAWTYATSALQTHKKAGDLPVHLTLSTMELGLVQFQTGKLTRALRAWREALQLACMTLGYDHLQVAILLNNMGCLHYQLGNFSASLRALEESLDLHRVLLRANSECCSSIDMPLFQMATTMGNLAIISAKFKNYESSISFLEEAIAIQESLAASTHPDKVYLAAELYLEQLRDAEADGSARNVHATAEEHATTHSLSTFNSIVQPTIALFGDIDGIPRRHEASKNNQLSSRPQIREDDNDYIYDCILLGSLVKPATARQRVHMTMTSSLDRVARTNQPDLTLADDDASFSSATLVARKKQSIPVDLDGEAVIDAEFHLEEIHLQALDHLCRNEFKDALDLFESALRNHKEKYGDVHHLVGTGLHNCGIVHLVAENYGQAKLCFQEAVVVRTSALGDSHPDVAASLFKIGMIEMAQGQLPLALTTFMDILTQLQKNMTTYGFGPEAKMLNNLGAVLYEMGRDTDAFDSFHKAYEIQKGLVKYSQGSRVAERALANTLSNLGFIYSKQGEYNEALKAFKESLAILTKYYPLDHPSVVVAEENIAHVRAYGAVDDRQQQSHAQSSFFESCTRIGKNTPKGGGYAQSKISACFHLQ